jgi:hypothetical protein
MVPGVWGWPLLLLFCFFAAKMALSVVGALELLMHVFLVECLGQWMMVMQMIAAKDFC